MRYEILVDDNFHYMDEDARASAGVFDSATTALATARGIVDASLAGLLRPGMSAAQLFDAYKSFGDDPFVKTDDRAFQFSAWTYARERCVVLCPTPARLMTTPNTLIFVDLASSDPAAAGRFYAEVFGWRNDERPLGLYHRMVPGGMFRNPDGSDSEIGNLHLGIFKADNARPHPEPTGVEPRTLSTAGRKPRIWILIGDDDSAERILGAAEERGATILWRNHYWAEFNGYNHAFADPWGNEIILWGKAGPEPKVPDDFTRE